MGTKKLQILGQLGEKIYKQDEEPVDAPDGTLWVDTDAEASAGGGSGAAPKEWKKVAAIKVQKKEEISHVTVTEDSDGNPLSFDEAIVMVAACRPSSYSSNMYYTVGPYNGWIEDFSQYGFCNFLIDNRIRLGVVKLSLLGGGFLEAHVAPQVILVNSYLNYDGFASEMMPISWGYGTEGSMYAITIPKDINSDIISLNEDGKMCGITIGVDRQNWYFCENSTFEVWVR